MTNKKHHIQHIYAREILDSRGYPTVEAVVSLKSGICASASVPAGATMGEHESWELRDNDPNRFQGHGVLRACEHIRQDIASALAGKDVFAQETIDETLVVLDGTHNKARLGANALLGVSLACARAASIARGIPLYAYLKECYRFPTTTYRMPIPMINMFNGGKHADTNLDFQEFMVVPRGIATFREQLRMGVEIYHRLGRILLQRGLDTDVGIEGGYAPNLDVSVDALSAIMSAIEEAGAHAGADVGIALDVGASSLYDEHKHQYIFRLDESFLSSDQLISLYLDWLRMYPLISIEDGLDQNDWVGWQQMTQELTRGKDVLVVGDDVFATNIKRLEKGIADGIANAIVIKPNQAGTLSETVACVKEAQAAKYAVIVSQRSGDTTDDFVSDLAVALHAEYLKGGSVTRGERVGKYNRLIAIEEELGL